MSAVLVRRVRSLSISPMSYALKKSLLARWPDQLVRIFAGNEDFIGSDRQLSRIDRQRYAVSKVQHCDRPELLIDIEVTYRAEMFSAERCNH